MRAITGGRAATQADRIAALEQRADKHDEIVKPMADQVAEMYGLLTRARTINWFVVKVFAIVGGGLGFIAVVLTITANAVKLVSGH